VRLNAVGIPDRLFPLYRVWGDLRFMDGAIDPSDRATPMCYRGHPALANRGTGLGRANMLKTWLSMWSLETSRCQGGEQLAKIADPALVVLGTADTGVFPSDARKIFEALASADKKLEFVPGAHYFEDSTACRHDVADLMCGWITARV
jgi:pimeloyl-ACP methyl ester carboxylesterase